MYMKVFVAKSLYQIKFRGIAFYKFLYYIFSLQEIWYKYLGDKIKNELRNERTDPVVLARKRKNADGQKNTAKRKAVRRGIVNWAPPAIAGEDDASCRSHVAWMQKEKKKRQHNQDLVSKKMELTFSFRRQMINGQKHLLKDIRIQYPFLFEKNHVSIYGIVI